MIDFTKTYMEEGVGILTLRPQVEANKEYKMFKPLSVTVWILIGVAIIVVGVVMFIVNRYSPCSTELEEHQHYLETENLSSSMWLIYGAFVEQGITFMKIDYNTRLFGSSYTCTFSSCPIIYKSEFVQE